MDKPLISILMAVYEPRMDWLEAQLKSLNAQDYPNIRLYIRDDCSPTVPFEAIAERVSACIDAFPYELRRNDGNMGSNLTFEALTREAEGTYFAYCDQDDEWLPEKLTALERAIEDSGALLVCSDMLIIDGDGNQIADSITRVRRHHVFRSGEGLAPRLLISNFVTGCTMLIRADVARAAAPFCPDMVHDHYLALFSAARGAIATLQRPLIRYRIHEGNQTLLMSGVRDRASYRRVRVDALIRRLDWLGRRFGGDGALADEIAAARAWAEARRRNFEGDRRARRTVWRLRRFGVPVSLFELVLARAPDAVFMAFIRLVRMNVL